MGTPSFADLVDRQVRAWQEQEHVAPEPGQGPTRQRPMIAVSRTYGALGGLVAQQAAALLGFDLFDREVVDRVARTAQVSQRVVESVDERLQDAISNWVADLFGAGRLAHHDYLATLARVVLTAGHHGRGVIVGRCAHLLLDPARTLSVRVVAPLGVRVERVAAHRHIPTDAAEARVHEVDRAREAFCRRGFGRSLEDPTQYDLVLDTGRLPVETCARIIVTAFQGRFPGADAPPIAGQPPAR